MERVGGRFLASSTTLFDFVVDFQLQFGTDVAFMHHSRLLSFSLLLGLLIARIRITRSHSLLASLGINMFPLTAM